MMMIFIQYANLFSFSITIQAMSEFGFSAEYFSKKQWLNCIFLIFYALVVPYSGRPVLKVHFSAQNYVSMSINVVGSLWHKM